MTLRRIAWAVWVLAAAVLWFFENNAATLTLLLSSIILPFFSILLAVSAARRTKFAIFAPQSALKGSEFTVRFKLHGRLSGFICCENLLSGEKKLLPLDKISAEITLVSEHCGVLRLHSNVHEEDFFGLWRSGELPFSEEFVTVYPTLFFPRVSLSENTTVISDSEQYSRVRPGSDPSETFSVREYMPGDPIRRIHWKLSQKTEHLMLRELGLPVVNRTLLVFRNTLCEGSIISHDAADAMAEVFLSVSRALVGAGCIHTAAFAENGRYFLTEVQNEADFCSMELRLLSLSWEADGGALARLLAETPYAHVAVVSAAMPRDAASYCRGNRITFLMPNAEGRAEGVYKVSFTEENYADELQDIEL